MYQPWGNDPADAIIKLIEEREGRQEYENDEWSIVSYKRLEETGEVVPECKIEQETSIRQWHHGPRQLESRPREPRARDRGASSRPAPAATWGSKVAESINKQLKAENLELTVRKRSESNSSEESLELRSRRRHASPEKYDRRTRSRSWSLPRDKKRHRRNPRTTKRRSRSRSTSRDVKRKRSVSRDRKRERSDSRDRKRRRNSSRDRKADRSDRYRSRSRSTERKRSTRSPRKCSRSPSPKAQDKPAEATTEMFSKFVSMMQEVKTKKEQSAPAPIMPNPNVLPEFDSGNDSHAILPWLLRVDDVAKLFGWGDKETIQFALPKLVGDAQTWYQTLETVPYTWAEWRKILKEKFGGPSYSRLIVDMIKRHPRPLETLEKYFQDKMLLVNRCGFKGRYAVDFIQSGVRLESIRLCAEAADFAEPEELLKYFKSVEAVWLANQTKPKTGLKNSELICTFCGRVGHLELKCWVKLRRTGAANPEQILENRAPPPPPPPNVQKNYPKPFVPQKPKFPVQPNKKPKKNKEIRLCFLCNEAGHLKNNCPQKESLEKLITGIDAIADTEEASILFHSVDSTSAVSTASNMNEPAPPGVE